MTPGLARFAEVAVPLGIQDTLTYRIPEELGDDVRLGSRVEVLVGPRLTTGFVTALTDTSELDPKKVRPVRSVLDDEEPALTPEILELCQWAAEYYMAPVGEMIRTALPPSMASKGKRSVSLIADEDTVSAAIAGRRITTDDLTLIGELRKRALPMATVITRRGGRAAVARLREAALVDVTDDLRDGAGVRFDQYVVLAEDATGLPEKQQALVDHLRARGGEVSRRALRLSGIGDSPVATLVKKGIVAVEKRHRRHTLDAFLADMDPAALGEIRYSDEQQVAIDAVRSSLGTFQPFLLEGVTGSGKTEVYVELMREVVRRGQQAILLVPEIALTPVFAARLKERFGERIAILHSSLSPSEKYDQWWRSRRGEVDVAIGPRSALFTPFPRLGLLVVDEEGDSAYKQDERPRYNARDVAVVRARMAQIPVILGSATPSLESRENAERGRYRLLTMKRRVESRPLPDVTIVDIRKERGEKEDRGMIILSAPVRDDLQKVFDAGEQAIIFLNRRGYAPFLLCRECENDFRCRDCSVTLTVHRRAGMLVCHYCGFRIPLPPRCPLCTGEVLQPIGFGTEKVEERFRQYFPSIPVEVLDRDSTRKKGELVRILDRFRRRETQALIGTQMLSKGHHFPSVTLTAVINADAILGYPDFRSAEKTFYLLTQVAGRSGRGELPGRVLIQTAFPQHYAIQHAIHHDYEAFFEAEIQFRKVFHYPPVTALIALLFRGEDESAVRRAAEQIAVRIERAAGDIGGLRIQGPAPAPLARIKGVYRYQILLRAPKRQHLHALVRQAMDGQRWAGVEAAVDVDPINIL